MKRSAFRRAISLALSLLIGCSGFSYAIAANENREGKTANMLNNLSGAAIPSAMMRVSANSSNGSYPPSNAIDGDTGTIWHSEWTPENVPFPHIFTISLSKKLTLDSLSILPRQDADAGKTTSGQIYAGDSLDDMTMVTAFTGDTSRNATVVDLSGVQAKYIQIYSLAANSANTAIAEITLTTSEQSAVQAFSEYLTAENLLQKAVAGDHVGEYDQADIDAFRTQVDGFLAELEDESLSEQDYLELSERIKAACDAFASKAKSYGKEDLQSFMEQLKQLKEEAIPQADRDAAEALLIKAQEVYADPDASKQAVQDMAVDLLELINVLSAAAQGACSLAGEWEFALNAYNGGTDFSGTVSLPGTLDTNKQGTYNGSNDIERLSRLYKYTGPATYQKEWYISEQWAGKSVTLYMERSRETRVWVNGTEVTSDDRSILPVSQSYDITNSLKFGQYNTIAIQVDNSYSDLPAESILRSHMAADETQTNWNGIVGDFELQINDKVFIDDLRVYPNEDLTSVKVEADVTNTSDAAYTGVLTFSCPDTEKRTVSVALAPGESKTFTVSDYAMPENVKLWSEFDTPLYEMAASLDSGSTTTQTFGMRYFSKGEDGTSLTINGAEVFLRGETNCAVFPITGYAPMDEADWEELFTVYQSYGINFVRFHSWCPPDAAFQAADKLGLYLQPELSCWDGGMLDNDVKKNYYSKEAHAIVKEYANHPSFVMLSFGNELSYSTENYQYADQLIGDLKQQDPTRLYAPGSNVGFGGTTPSSNTDFYTAQQFANIQARGSYGGLDGFVNQQAPSSDVNYDAVIEALAEYHVPFFNFEVGQYQVFPDVLTETDQYTGVLAARNFEMILDKIEEKGLSEEDVENAINASGMLSRLAYKAEIEAALRTEDMSGIALLGIQDFCGQGTALVGMMNALGDPKPYDFADPEEFSSFFNPTVVLFESSKFTYKNSETLTGNLLLSNYSQDDISGEIKYQLSSQDGSVFFEGATGAVNFKQGELTNAGQLSIPLDDVTEPTQFTLTVSCLDSKNSYHIWVYPDEGQADDGEVYVTESLDDTALSVLQNGGSVFISPTVVKTSIPDSLEGRFTTAFWSTWDTSQPGTMGLLLDPSHPLFQKFPTDYYSDYQWWAVSRYGRPMNLEALTGKNGEKIEPVVKVLDGFTNLNNLGFLYEAKVGNGKIMVSSMNLENLKYEYPEAMALRNAIISYMNSDDFNPETELTAEQINSQIKAFTGNKDNLALGKNVFESDAINAPEWAEENLVDGLTVSNQDGNGIYGYSSNADYPLTQTDCNAGFIVDLGRSTEFNRVVLYPRTDVVAAGTTNGAANFPRTFEIQASDDISFSTYDVLCSQTDVTTTIDQPVTLEFDSVTKRYIRLRVTQMGMSDSGDRGRVQLAEFEVYNDAPDPIPVTGVTLNQSEITLKAGENAALTAAVTPEDATNKTVTWSSSDQTVAVVDQSGNISALSAGTAIIQVTTAEGGFTAQCTVHVTDEPTDPGDSSEPTDPGDSSEPTDPGDSSEPTDPGDSSEPTDPGDSSEPADPGDSSEPTDPGDSSEPADPGDSSEPSNPTTGSGTSLFLGLASVVVVCGALTAILLLVKRKSRITGK